MVLNIKNGLTFDDVILEPKYSTVASRKNVDLSVNLGKGIELGMPIISANMKNVTGLDMCLKIAELGGLAILNRFFNNPLVEQINIFKTCIEKHKSYENHIGVSIGVQKNDLDFVGIYIDNGIRIVCLDIAHGHSQAAIDLILKIKSKYPKVFLIAGNVATAEGFCALAKAGADAIKINIGAGSSCLTRIETGNGVPQLTALNNCYDAMNDYYPNVKIIADGACKVPADLVKSLCFSHVVMLGNMLAGSDEAPGSIINIEGRTYKSYAGSSTLKKEHVEGVSGHVPTKGPVENVVNKILQGIRSGCSYQGVHNLEDLRKDPKFILMTGNGLVESKAHDIHITK